VLTLPLLWSCGDDLSRPRLVSPGDLPQSRGEPSGPKLQLHFETELNDNDTLSSAAEFRLFEGGQDLVALYGSRLELRLGSEVFVLDYNSSEKLFSSGRRIPSSTADFGSWMGQDFRLFTSDGEALHLSPLQSPRPLTDLVNPESFAARIFLRCENPVPQLSWRNPSAASSIFLEFSRPSLGLTKTFGPMPDSGAWPGSGSAGVSLYRQDFFQSLIPENERGSTQPRKVRMRSQRTSPIQSQQIRLGRVFNLKIEMIVEEIKNLELVYQESCL